MKPRLLFLCQTTPYPPDGGVWIRSFHVLRLLSQEFDVTALCFERSMPASHGVPFDAAAAAWELGSFAQTEIFELPQLHSRWRFFWDHLRSVATGRVFTEFVLESSRLRGRLREHLDHGGFSLVHADSMDLCGYFDEIQRRDIPIVCVHHNVESQLLARRSKIERSPIRRLYAGMQSRLQERTERRWCPRVTVNVTVSEPDRDLLASMAPDSRFLVVPNGVDTDFFNARGGSSDATVVFVGGVNWFPNRDALDFYVDEVLPRVREEIPTLRSMWVGAAPEEVRRSFADRGVELTGYVDDVRPIVAGASCFIVPLRVGGGSRLKILDAWSMAMPVVSTAVGCEGLRTRDGENIAIANDASAFAAAVIRLIRDPSLAAKLGSEGRRTVETHYDWDEVGRMMLPTYRAVAKATTV